MGYYKDIDIEKQEQDEQESRDLNSFELYLHRSFVSWCEEVYGKGDEFDIALNQVAQSGIYPDEFIEYMNGERE